MMTDTPGKALIKPEYVVAVSDAAEQDGEATASGERRDVRDDRGAAGGVKRPADQEHSSQHFKKKKGMNKSRPRLIKEPRCNKLCRFLWAMTEEEYNTAVAQQQQTDSGQQTVATEVDNKDEAQSGPTESSTLPEDQGKPSVSGGSSNGRSKEDRVFTTHPLCPYDNCQYSHDVDSFLTTKPKDLGDTCHNLAAFGMCEYGLICRFGSEHIRNNFNVRNEELWSQFKEKELVTNHLPKDTQTLLRKKRYDFSSSSIILKNAQQQKNLSMNGSAARIQSLDTSTAEGGAASSNGDPRPETAAAVAKEHASNGASHLGTCSDGIVATGVSGNGALNERVGAATDEDMIRVRPAERKKIVWRDQLYLAPLTTLGNLPFRRICRRLGADITCGEMAVATSLLQGSPSEWALVKRHHTEAVFGAQVCGSNPEAMIKCSELLTKYTDVDFVDINVGCPIDLIYKQGAGSALMRRTSALELMVRGMSKALLCPLTVKIRTSIHMGDKTAHTIIPRCREWGADLVTLHGRSREQRYTKSADWAYIQECAEQCAPLPLFGNGDILNYEDYNARKSQANVEGIMIGRGALMKPWIFTEIKEQKHWDISSSERYDILKEFVNNGFEHWGSDSEGVEKTRRFLLEWLSFLHRYIPLGLLERPPQTINQKPPQYIGRNHLETLMASKSSQDWIKISEMLLRPVPDNFIFLPKHKANSWG